MKKIFFLMTLVLLGQATIKAQTNSYIPFPKEACSQVWRTDANSSTGTTTTIHATKVMQGDTIINGLKYIKYYDPDLISAIRDDSVNKKVFCYDFTSKKETLLYDFNLNVGDTVLVLNLFNKNIKYWVTDIDSVLLLDHRYHNRYRFNNPGNSGMTPLPELSPLVEGLGYFDGNKFRHTNVPNPDIMISYATICASANKKILIAMFGIPPNGEYCGAIITGMQTLANKDEFTLYPNPTTGKLQLKTEYPDASAVEIINTLGKKIFTTELKNETIEIDLSNYPMGIYFAVLHSKEGKIFSRKIIKN